MQFLNNIKIKNKLLLLVSFPLMGLLYFSGLSVYKSYNMGNDVSNTNVLVNVSVKISALIHETQKERGMTAGFIGSDGKNFGDKLSSQRVLTDKALENLKSFINTVDFSLYPKQFEDKVNNAISNMSGVINTRSQVSSLSIKLGVAIAYYTNTNTQFLNIVNSTVKLSTVAEATKNIAAYSAFLQSKERAGIERAVGANTLSRDRFATGMKEKFSNLISSQNSYLDTFKGYSSPKEIGFLNKTVSGTEIDDVNRVRKILTTANEIGGFNTDAEYWFATITKKIGLLKKTENYIRDNLRITHKDIRAASNVAAAAANLLHETQKERGSTAGFLGSKGTKFTTALTKQRKLTNQKIAKLTKIFNIYHKSYHTKQMHQFVVKIKSNLENISNIRSQVSTLNISTSDAIKYYTSINNTLLNTVAMISKMAKSANESSDLHSYYNFLMSKERAGIERAVMSNSFARNKFLPGMKVKFTKLVTEQDAYMNAFLNTASPKYITYYNKTVQGVSIDEVNRMRQIAFDAVTVGGFGESSSQWFSNMTIKINKLKKVNDWLSQRLLKKLEDLESQATIAMYTDLIVSVFIHLIVGFMSYFITTGIVTNLSNFKTGLNFFFAYAVREKEYMKPMKVVGQDEFTEMTMDMNIGIKKTTFIIEQDKKVVQEIDDVMHKVGNGFFTYTIHEKGATSEVENLRVNINEMLEETKTKLDNINIVLGKYGEGIYNYRLSDQQRIGLYGDFGTLTTGLSALGHDISNFMALFSNAIDDLNNNTNILTSTATSISNSSATQAQSLNETAVSVEEITANINNSTANVSTMSKLSDEVRVSASNGQELASQTAKSMEEISSEVIAISDAISVIDQIAFQTNILSLNAAVEAATAGEAGKGFAVVAQEVRNLASRSADAANEIKALVDNAIAKANSGKKIASDMIEGYTQLSGKISETKDIIDEVSVASKEQAKSIVVINSNITGLDSVTQENAQSASSLESIASQIEKLSGNLSGVMSGVTFDDRTKLAVSDPDMTSVISNFKKNHIDFKSNQFKKLDEFTTFKVVNEHDCKLGQWIDVQEKNQTGFTKSAAWEKLKDVHSKIHGEVQNYVDKNAQKANNEELALIAKTIEDETIEVFDDLNGVLASHCKYLKS